MIGADGLRSGTREHETETDETYPPYAGYTLWHAIIPTDDALVPRGEFRLSLGRGDRFVSFPVDEERVYWSALSHVAAGGRDKGRRLEALRDAVRVLRARRARPDRRDAGGGDQPRRHLRRPRPAELGQRAA